MAIETGEKGVEADEEGFLLDPSQWDREVALCIARGERLEM